jgi:hypothetical protein
MAALSARAFYTYKDEGYTRKKLQTGAKTKQDLDSFLNKKQPKNCLKRDF